MLTWLIFAGLVTIILGRIEIHEKVGVASLLVYFKAHWITTSKLKEETCVYALEFLIAFFAEKFLCQIYDHLQNLPRLLPIQFSFIWYRIDS